MAFQSEFPAVAAQKIVDYLMAGAGKPDRTIVEAAYDVLGYGLFIVYGQVVTPGAKIARPFHMGDAKAQGENLQTALKAPLEGFPWATLLSIVLEIITKYLGG